MRWRWWEARRAAARERVAEQRARDFCPTCDHPWSGHGYPEGCSDCDYDISHGYDGAPDSPCTRTRPTGLTEALPAEARRVRLDDRGVLVSPTQAGSALTTDLADLAARWLAVGLDTPALRELAGHPPHDPWGVDALWTAARKELSVDVPVDADEPSLLAVPVALARWRCGELTSDEVSASLLRGWDGFRCPVAGLGELFLLQESRVEASRRRLATLDDERERLLRALAAEVVLDRW